jgi:DNA polymerase-4
MERTIIHINVADFAVAVERRVDRRLRGRPVIIAPEGALRATVYDMSEEAFQAGVRKGMALRRAVRLCRDARILTPHPARYEQAMTDLLRLALPYSPLIEPGECDGHLFVDATGTGRLFGPAVDVAFRLRRQARNDLELDPIWSLAANKLVAKVASRLVKPLGEYIVGPGDEEALLAPLPLWLIPGLEGPDLDRLRELNLTQVRQVSGLRPDHLETILGNRAAFVSNALRGIDHAPVLPAGRQPPRIMLDHVFGSDTNSPAAVQGAAYALVEQAGRRLRDQGRAARRTRVGIDYSDGRRCARQVRVQPATGNDLALFPFVRRALQLAWTRRVRVRRLRLTCDRLVYPPAQLALFEDDSRVQHKQDHLIAAVDRIRDRFGTDSIRVGQGAAA